jgi:hypothetical protein
VILSQKNSFFAKNASLRAFARARRCRARWRAACTDRRPSSGGNLPFVFGMNQKNPKSD